MSMQRKYHSDKTFIDLLFNMVLLFMTLFVLSFILISPITKTQQAVELKAEYIITIMWDKDLDDDVDSYLEDPLNHLVGFMRREDGLMHLDRDDLGFRSDTIMTPSGPIALKENREIITIRGIIPGEYTLNVHMYHKNSGVESTKVTARIEKLNPSVQTILVKDVNLMVDNDEKTICRFILNQQGDIIEISDLPKELVKRERVPESELR